MGPATAAAKAGAVAFVEAKLVCGTSRGLSKP